ncbi:MAG: NUDIX hydrolase [Thermodesulfovibrionales bacterium]
MRESRPATLKRQASAGGVIFRRSGSSNEIVLVSVRGGRAWCLPKGLVDKGETTEATALREVKEETGLVGRIVDRLGDITYWYYVSGENVKCRKTVTFYLMEVVSGDTRDHDHEVDQAVWMTVDEALQKVSFRGDRQIIEKAQEKLDNACAQTA